MNNRRGSILIIGCMTLYVLMALSAAFAMQNFNELNNARRYYFGARAFWIAEAGVNMYMKNPAMLDDAPQISLEYGGGRLTLTKDSSKFVVYTVDAQGSFAGVTRTVQITYPANIPEVFKNAFSTQGDMKITGKKVSLIVGNKSRLSGNIVNRSKFSNIFMEDVEQYADSDLTSIVYPDSNANGIRNERGDFIAFNRRLVASYDPQEVLSVQTDGTFTVTDQLPLEGKKVLYVEGADVVINSNLIVQPQQNLTVITAGTVTFNQNGFQPDGSQLNIIAWSGYRETNSAPSLHKGIIFTNFSAEFDNIRHPSATQGGIVANGGIQIAEVWGTKTIEYANTLMNGILPPGFEGLIMHSAFKTRSVHPVLWKEIQ